MWITVAGANPTSYGVYYFRKGLEIAGFKYACFRVPYGMMVELQEGSYVRR